MDFFEQQDLARKKSKQLIILFILACVCMVAVVYLVIGLIVSYNTSMPLRFDPTIFLIVAGCVMLTVGAGSGYKISKLSSGGPAVATLLGGKPVSVSTTDPRERRLLNIVDEMSIASGVPVPEVYVLQNEQGINAFAAGTKAQQPSDTVIGVTRGCLENLNREELQGVIAHEYSHILSGDMKLNIRLMGLVHGILLIGLIGYYIIRGTARGRSSKGKGQAMLVGLALMAIGFTGTAFGNLIKAAVSRQREFLADAAGTQFTRNPTGLATALAKIGGFAPNGLAGSRLTNPAAPQASHFYFAQGVETWLAALYATHPPIRERIKRLDESVLQAMGRHSKTPGPASSGTAVEGASGLAASTPLPQPESIPGFGSHPEKPQPDAGSMASAVESIGIIKPEHLEYARQQLAALPTALREAVHSSFSSCALVCALLLDDDQAIRKHQFAMVEMHLGRQAMETTNELYKEMDGLDASCRPLLVELALSAVSKSTMSQYSNFKTTVKLLIEADQRMDLFEWMVHRSILGQLESRFHPSAPQKARYSRPHDVEDDLSLLLSNLARAGSSDEAHISHSFRLGAAELGMDGLTLQPPESYRLDLLDDSLERLNLCAPRLKKQILSACAACISADKWINQHEGELLRAISASLECPMPLLLPGQPLV